MARKFTFEDLMINDKSQLMSYQRRTDIKKRAIHWGQRKLLLSEIEFFTIYWDANEVRKPLCVYAGAAPGTHIPLLAIMFPDFTFHLYDPSPFNIEETDNIKLFNEYFTDEVCKKYQGRKDVFFVSDIRTANYKLFYREELEKRGVSNFTPEGDPIASEEIKEASYKESSARNERVIWGDMLMQQKWVQLIDPVHALLKFRLPYSEGKEQTVKYLQGHVYFQLYPPQTSTETRLKPVRDFSGKYYESDWEAKEYEEWCFHHNAVVRENYLYENPFSNKSEPIDYPELLNDYDSVAEAFILKLYLEKFGYTYVYDRTKTMSGLITWYISESDFNLDGRRKTDMKKTAKRMFPDVKHKLTQEVKILTKEEKKPVGTKTSTFAISPKTMTAPTVMTPPVNLGTPSPATVVSDAPVKTTTFSSPKIVLGATPKTPAPNPSPPTFVFGAPAPAPTTFKIGIAPKITTPLAQGGTHILSSSTGATIPRVFSLPKK